jgi:hypothetical protein
MTLEQGKPMKEALGEVLDLYHPLMSVGACDFEVLLGPDWLLLCSGQLWCKFHRIFCRGSKAYIW